MIILEQPEIHLHPKVQSLLFDFSVALLAKRVSLLIETHSDHFINRLRRRVAESSTQDLRESISLMFVSTDEDGSRITQ
jgi:predicted ATPase